MPNAENQQVEKCANGEKMIECTQRGKDTYISQKRGFTVYDSKNKKRIGKDGKVIVRLGERIVWNHVEYIVSEISDFKVILKKI